MTGRALIAICHRAWIVFWLLVTMLQWLDNASLKDLVAFGGLAFLPSLVSWIVSGRRPML